MAYDPLYGIWVNTSGLTDWAGPGGSSTGYWQADPQINYGAAPSPNAYKMFDPNTGQFTGWTDFGFQNEGSMMNMFGSAKPSTFNNWMINPQTGQLEQSTGQNLPSYNNVTNAMSYIMPLVVAATAGGAAAGAGAGVGAEGMGVGAAPGEAAGSFTGSFGSGGGGSSWLSSLFGGGGGSSATGGSGNSLWSGLSNLFGGGGSSAAGGSGMSSWASTIKDWLPIIGAVGGAFQGSKDQTVTNTTQLPSWLQALGPAYTNASIAASQQPFTAFGQYNPDQLAAFQAARNLSQGTPLQATGTDALTRAMQGGTNPYFGMDNPYTQKAIDKAAADTTRNFNNAVLPGLDSMSARANTGFGVSSAFDGSGGLRSEAYRNLGDTLANQANDMRYKDLFAQQQLGESNAARQIQAANLVPNYSAMNWSNIEPLLNIGNQQQNLSYNEFLRGQNWTDQMLKRLGSPFGFNQGTTSTSTAPGVGAVAGGISGLLGGYGMSQLGNNPFGRATQQTPTSDFQGFSWGYTPWGVF